MSAVKAARVGGAGGARMLAWRLHAAGAPAELRLDEARVPPLRAPRHVLVRVQAAALNPLDVAMLGGYGSCVLSALRGLEGAEPAPPLVPGRDFAGRVQRAGPAARLRPGARVWGVVPPHRAGALAQYVLVDDRLVGAAPRALSGVQAGGALYAALTACSLLRAAGLRPDGAGAGGAPRVLLLGLGGVGQAALQLLARGGARVAAACSPELAPLAAALGARAALDRHAPDYDRQLDAAAPFDVVLDCAGLGGEWAGAGGAAAGGAVALRRWRCSRYVTLSSPLLRLTDQHGLLAGTTLAAAELAAQNVAARAAGASGAGAEGAAPQVRWAFFSPCAADIEMLRRLADRGEFTVHVEQVWGWWQAREALERAARGGARGKLVLDFTAPAPAL